MARELGGATEIETAGGGHVRYEVADVTTSEGRDVLLAACPEPDILVNNAGGPPPGDFRDWDQQDWFDAVNANMFSAIDMIRRVLDGMVERRFGRIVNITSVAVKMPVKTLGMEFSTINPMASAQMRFPFIPPHAELQVATYAATCLSVA